MEIVKEKGDQEILFDLFSNLPLYIISGANRCAAHTWGVEGCPPAL